MLNFNFQYIFLYLFVFYINDLYNQTINSYKGLIMHKKTLVIIALSLLIASPAFAAQSLKVSAINDFTTVSPTKTMNVMAIERMEFKNGIIFENGTVINGQIFDVKQPKRGKRNASFKFKPISYTYNGKTTAINDENFIGKYKEYKELNKAEIAGKAATTAGGMILNVPLFSQGISLIKGMWKNNEDNRLKSGVVQVYKDSPLTYVEEGKDVVIKEDDIFILKFKSSDTEDWDAEEETRDPNQEYVRPTSSLESVPVAPSNSKFVEIKHPEEILKEIEEKNRQNN